MIVDRWLYLEVRDIVCCLLIFKLLRWTDKNVDTHKIHNDPLEKPKNVIFNMEF